MADLFENKELMEKVILVGIDTGEDDAPGSLDELEELVETAGGVTLAKVVQNREKEHPGTYIGKGKIEEIRIMIGELGATGIVCDDELSPAQLKNLEEALDTKIMDRTLIILDIFAARASTNEGKIQVELAQLKYRMSRLAGLGSSLSRLGGGIGTRGPGEKKIETDRRLIRSRISQLNEELKQIRCHRDVLRAHRDRQPMAVAAIVGYTNAGKSTLLNTLTDAEILAEDKLFATLDPTTRMLQLPKGENVLLTDTVGFIRKLPHHLIDAFRSTLEEAKYADIIIHVVDASNKDMDIQMHVVYDTLRQLGVENKPVITLFNKVDKLTEMPMLRDFKADKTLSVSARTGVGLETFKEAVEDILRQQKIYVNRVYGYDEAGKLQYIRKYGQLLREDYTEEGIVVEAYVPVEIYDKVR